MRFAAFTLASTATYVFVLGAVAVYLLAKIIQRYRSLARFRHSVMSPEELKGKLDSGADLLLLDLRHPLETLSRPYRIPGALFVSPAQLHKLPGIPRHHALVFYCTSRDEVTTSRLAALLVANGFSRVYALAGGLDAWRAKGYDLDYTPQVALGATA